MTKNSIYRKESRTIDVYIDYENIKGYIKKDFVDVHFIARLDEVLAELGYTRRFVTSYMNVNGPFLKDKKYLATNCVKIEDTWIFNKNVTDVALAVQATKTVIMNPPDAVLVMSEDKDFRPLYRVITDMGIALIGVNLTGKTIQGGDVFFDAVLDIPNLFEYERTRYLRDDHKAITDVKTREFFYQALRRMAINNNSRMDMSLRLIPITRSIVQKGLNVSNGNIEISSDELIAMFKYLIDEDFIIVYEDNEDKSVKIMCEITRSYNDVNLTELLNNNRKLSMDEIGKLIN